MGIPKEYIAEMSRRIDISELIGSYVPLKRAGRLEKGLCPFHNEKSPSFTVYPDSQSFYCFGCGAGGDGVSFIMRMQNLEYGEAVRYLASRLGMPLPNEDDQTAKQRTRILAINRESARYYAQQLNEEAGGRARAYLRTRALSDKIIRRFGLGYAPDAFGSLRDHLKQQGFQEAELLLAGVCKKSEKGGIYDAFRGRIIFPIMDLRGNVIAFGGRKMAEDDFGPKYLNSAETRVFQKSKTLYAMNIVKKSISKRYLLAEGYMDVISLHQAGFDTALASLGTAITDEQARLIANHADEVVICYDADEAGQKATVKAIGKFGHTDIKVRVLNLPGAKDPDEFIRKNGKERFEALLDGSKNALEYELHKARSNVDLTMADGRAAYLKSAIEILVTEAGPVERDIYAGQLAQQTDVGKEAIIKQLETAIRQRQRRMKKRREEKMREEGVAAGIHLPYQLRSEKAIGIVFAEQQLMAALLKNPEDFIRPVRTRLTVDMLVSDEMKAVYQQIIQAADAGLPLDLSLLSEQLEEKTINLMGRILALNHDIGFTKEDVELFLHRVEEGGNSPLQVSEMNEGDFRQYFEQKRECKE